MSLIVPHIREGVREIGWFTIQKFYADELATDPRATPYDVIESDHNLLLTSGANAYHQRLIATAVNAFNVTNARIAVGDGTAAPAIGQTDLQGATKTRKVVDATPSISGNQISFVATFLTGEGNHAWNEAGIANAASAGDMLNRIQQSFGTKTAGLQWVITGTIALV